jgi:hypothetical protein
MIRRAYYRWLDRRTGYYRRRAEIAEGERDSAVAVLWLVRDAFGHLDAGHPLDDGEARDILNAADDVLDRLLITTKKAV